MEYRGIRYDLRIGIEPNQWVWTIHTPHPKRGQTRGSRQHAVAAAERAIQAWCYQHPTDCADPVAPGAAVERPAPN